MVKDGETDTANFCGSASLSGVDFQDEVKSFINIYNGTDTQHTPNGIIDVSKIQNLTNTITLYDYATLSLNNIGDGVFTSSTLGNTLHFKGNGGILKSGFGATENRKVSIKVGEAWATVMQLELLWEQ